MSLRSYNADTSALLIDQSHTVNCANTVYSVYTRQQEPPYLRMAGLAGTRSTGDLGVDRAVIPLESPAATISWLAVLSSGDESGRSLTGRGFLMCG